jgi:superoxide dismutase
MASSAQPASSAAQASGTAPSGEFKLPPLPYALDALVPHISAETLKFHYGKHHQGALRGLLLCGCALTRARHATRCHRARFAKEVPLKRTTASKRLSSLCASSGWCSVC